MASPKPQLRDAPPIRKIQTDHGAEFAFAFVLAVERRGIRHRYIRPRCPEQNGKVERSHQIDHEEFWSQQSFERFGAASSFEKLSAAISRRAGGTTYAPTARTEHGGLGLAAADVQRAARSPRL